MISIIKARYNPGDYVMIRDTIAKPQGKIKNSSLVTKDHIWSPKRWIRTGMLSKTYPASTCPPNRTTQFCLQIA